jgi:hypothetical protein
MEKNLDPYECWHLEKYKCMPNEGYNPLEAEEFENGFYKKEKEQSEWHNEAPF